MIHFQNTSITLRAMMTAIGLLLELKHKRLLLCVNTFSTFLSHHISFSQISILSFSVSFQCAFFSTPYADRLTSVFLHHLLRWLSLYLVIDQRSYLVTFYSLDMPTELEVLHMI